MEQQFFEPKDIAKLFGMSPYTVRDLCRRGKLRHVKWGKLIRIKREWVELFIKQHTKG